MTELQKIMPELNEIDTCSVFITPALKTAGWCAQHWQIVEQHYFTDSQIYPVYPVGDGYDLRKRSIALCQ